MNKRTKLILSLIILILLSLVLRIVLGLNFNSFHSDMGLFREWAEKLNAHGLGYIYENSSCDYPPVYLYVLWALGGVDSYLKSVGADSSFIELIFKIPSIIFDILTALLIYKIAAKNQSQNKAILIMCMYLFNPIVILNSTLWGQIDSILAFFVLLTVYLVYRKKMCWSYLIFCIGVIIKPQIIFIAPVILLGIINNVFIKDFSIRKFFKHLGCGMGSILVCLLVCLPFNIVNVISQYKDTIGSFPYATMNAYNFWGMLGLNNESQETKWIFNAPVYIWGYFFIAIICLIVFYLWFFVYKKKRKNSYFYLTALLISGVFTFSVRMHERYMFPVTALLLAFCAIYFSAGNIILYILASVLQVINVFSIYMYYAYAINVDFDQMAETYGILMFCFYLFMLYKAFNLKKQLK